MSFLAGTTGGLPKREQKALGQDVHRGSTSEQARPVPYLAGKNRIGLTFISDVFNQRADAVYQEVGKQKTKAGYDYYASFAALVCHGPVDALHDIWLNGESVYASEVAIQCSSLTSAGTTATFKSKNAHGLATGDSVVVSGAEQAEYNGAFPITVTDTTHFTYDMRVTSTSPATGKPIARLQLDHLYRDGDNPDYVDVVIPDYGTMRLYWGTESQTADTLLNTSGVAHPAYRGLCYAVFDQLFMGFNQTNVPNVELVVARYPKPASEWHDLDEIEEDANPVAIVADILQNVRCGLALPDSRLNTTALAATAAAIAAEEFGISPLLLRQASAKQFLITLLEYIDAYPVTDADGKFSIALARPPVDDPIELEDADLTQMPVFTPEGWAAVHDETDVKFTNRAFQYKEDMVKWRDIGALAITGEPNNASVDREWITREAVAAAVAKSLGRSNALPKLAGTARVRKHDSLFADLAPGALFVFDISNRVTDNLVFRVIERTLDDPSSAEFDIRFKIDRSYLNTTVT